MRADLKFVVHPFPRSGHEQFPHPAPEQTPHRMDAAIPAIEIAHHAHAVRVRRPDREIDAVHSADVAQLRAELLPELEIVALGKEMQIHLAHDRPVAIRVARHLLALVPRDHAHLVIQLPRFPRQHRLEKTLGMQPIGRHFLSARDRDPHLSRVRPKNADDEVFAHAMRTKNAKRIGVATGEKNVHLIHREPEKLEIAHARATLTTKGRLETRPTLNRRLCFAISSRPNVSVSSLKCAASARAAAAHSAAGFFRGPPSPPRVAFVPAPRPLPPDALAPVCDWWPASANPAPSRSARRADAAASQQWRLCLRSARRARSSARTTPPDLCRAKSSVRIVRVAASALAGGAEEDGKVERLVIHRCE